MSVLRLLIIPLCFLGVQSVVCFSEVTVEADLPDPLTWDECVRLAMMHNPDLREAATRFSEAEGAKLEFRSGALPQAEVTAITFPPLAIIDVRQMVFDQRVLLAWEASTLAGQVARLNYQAVTNEVLTSLRLAYLNVLLLQEQQRMTQEVIQFLQNRQDNARSMFESGNLQRSELEQVRVRLNIIEDRLIGLEEQVDEAKLGLLEVLGAGQSVGEVAGSFEDIPPNPVDRERVVSMGLSRLPELRLLEVLAQGSEYQARIARAERYPNLYIFGRGEFSPGIDEILGTENRSEDSVSETAAAAAIGGTIGDGGGDGDDVSDPTTDTTGLASVESSRVGVDDDDEFEESRVLFGLIMRWQAFDGGAARGAARQNEVQGQQRLVNAEQIRLALPGQVQEAWEGIELARDLEGQTRSLPTLRDTLAMAREEYISGRAGQNETLAFALDSLQMHIANLQARYGANVGLTILRRISGQLLAFSRESGTNDRLE